MGEYMEYKESQLLVDDLAKLLTERCEKPDTESIEVIRNMFIVIAMLQHRIISALIRSGCPMSAVKKIIEAVEVNTKFLKDFVLIGNKGGN